MNIRQGQVGHIKKGLRQAQRGKFASRKELAQALQLEKTRNVQDTSRFADIRAYQNSAEDSTDLAAFKEPTSEPNLTLKSALKLLRKHRRP